MGPIPLDITGWRGYAPYMRTTQDTLLELDEAVEAGDYYQVCLLWNIAVGQTDLGTEQHKEEWLDVAYLAEREMRRMRAA